MTTTMIRFVMLTVLLHFFLVCFGVQCLQSEDGASLHSGALNLPWQDELCCDSPSAHSSLEGGGTNASETNRTQSNLPQHPRCSFRGLMTESHGSDPSGDTCVDILCRIDENWGNLTCDLQSHHQPSSIQEAGLMAVSLQRFLSQKDNTEMTAFDNPVVCEAEDSFTCLVTLDPKTSCITMVTVSISDAVASPVMLRIPARPLKPSPPVNLSHIQTTEADLIVHWDDPSDFDRGPLTYEVRYSSNNAHPAWQVVSAPEEPRVFLDLKSRLNYSVQVRCSGVDEPSMWSEWSKPHYIYLDTVSYIPEKVVARPGENVTIYCVFNDHSMNASTAVWMMNFERSPHHSRPVNQWVSQITVRPSQTQMYDLLRCTQHWTIPYSKIYVEGAHIDISCVTSSDIDSMTCNWNNTQMMKLKFQSKWADLDCDEMEQRESAGEDVGVTEPACMEKPCTIKPLRMNCYKLWLELTSPLGPIRSKPVYLTPIDHVKPHSPTKVKAVSQSSGYLLVTWEPPYLPVEGVQCQFRYHSASNKRVQPEWKVQSPVRGLQAQALVPDMCRAYVVQVRCMHISGTGYWSEWSNSVYSTPQNSRAPERGPDFWRIRQDDPQRNTSNVTLLFKDLSVSGNSYCVDGFILQRQASSGSVIRDRVELGAPYSFEWNQELLSVTVEAHNILGSSTNNINMTLEKQPKRRCVHLFHVLVINSTCVSLSWTLLDNSSVPLFMVVQWALQGQQQDNGDSGLGKETWIRLPYTDRPVYLKGDFFGSEEYGFHLYPVFAEGEGEPVYALATRGDPAAYMMLMVISFLSITLFVTLVISQNQMKKFVWKDVPNPKKCSWAKGLDFKKVDTFDRLFQPAEGLPTWPPLLPSENISSVIIMDNTLIQTPFVSLTPDPPTALTISHPAEFDSKVDQFLQGDSLQGEASSFAINLDALTTSSSGIDEMLPTDTSAQSSVTYSTVLISDPKQDKQNTHLHYKDGGSGNSSSDEGNFSANNSDISGSIPCGLWELDSCRLGDVDNPRHSCSSNSVEELSETSEQEDEGEEGKTDLYYLRMDYPAEDEASEEEEEQQREEEKTNTELLKNAVLNRDDCPVESHPLLELEDSTCSFTPLYMPQFRTAPCTRQLHNSSCE